MLKSCHEEYENITSHHIENEPSLRWRNNNNQFLQLEFVHILLNYLKVYIKQSCQQNKQLDDEEGNIFMLITKNVKNLNEQIKRFKTVMTNDHESWKYSNTVQNEFNRNQVRFQLKHAIRVYNQLVEFCECNWDNKEIIHIRNKEKISILHQLQHLFTSLKQIQECIQHDYVNSLNENIKPVEAGNFYKATRNSCQEELASNENMVSRKMHYTKPPSLYESWSYCMDVQIPWGAASSAAVFPCSTTANNSNNDKDRCYYMFIRRFHYNNNKEFLRKPRLFSSSVQSEFKLRGNNNNNNGGCTLNNLPTVILEKDNEEGRNRHLHVDYTKFKHISTINNVEIYFPTILLTPNLVNYRQNFKNSLIQHFTFSYNNSLLNRKHLKVKYFSHDNNNNNILYNNIKYWCISEKYFEFPHKYRLKQNKFIDFYDFKEEDVTNSDNSSKLDDNNYNSVIINSCLCATNNNGLTYDEMMSSVHDRDQYKGQGRHEHEHPHHHKQHYKQLQQQQQQQSDSNNNSSNSRNNNSKLNLPIKPRCLRHRVDSSISCLSPVNEFTKDNRNINSNSNSSSNIDLFSSLPTTKLSNMQRAKSVLDHIFYTTNDPDRDINGDDGDDGEGDDESVPSNSETNKSEPINCYTPSMLTPTPRTIATRRALKPPLSPRKLMNPPRRSTSKPRSQRNHILLHIDDGIDNGDYYDSDVKLKYSNLKPDHSSMNLYDFQSNNEAPRPRSRRQCSTGGVLSTSPSLSSSMENNSLLDEKCSQLTLPLTIKPRTTTPFSSLHQVYSKVRKQIYCVDAYYLCPTDYIIIIEDYSLNLSMINYFCEYIPTDMHNALYTSTSILGIFYDFVHVFEAIPVIIQHVMMTTKLSVFTDAHNSYYFLKQDITTPKIDVKHVPPTPPSPQPPIQHKRKAVLHDDVDGRDNLDKMCIKETYNLFYGTSNDLYSDSTSSKSKTQFKRKMNKISKSVGDSSAIADNMSSLSNGITEILK
ncbi:unnamed protein product [Trichobilharzia regenti]|nr:unnamed protein product [Trichobilharzia regenti]